MPSQASGLVLGTLGVAVLLVVVKPLRDGVAQYLATYVHESVHALVAVLTGSEVTAITVEPNRSGCTSFRPTSPLAKLLVWVAGYAGPSAVGLALAATVQYSVAGRTVLLVLLALILLTLIRLANSFAVFVFVVIVAGLSLFIHRAGPVSQEGVIIALAWLLLLLGLQNAVELMGIRRHAQTDAHFLEDLTGLPAAAWILLWIGFTVAALAIGARWLLF